MALDLDFWTADIVSRELGGRPDLAGASLRQAIDIYTREKLAETFSYAKENSAFYREKYEGVDVTIPEDLSGDAPEGWEHVPFMTAEHLCEHGEEMLCVSDSDAGATIRLSTSGTTGEPKEIIFTEEDHKHSSDFFMNGLRLVIDETDNVLILMDTSEGTLGRALADGAGAIGAGAIEYGKPFSSARENAEDEGKDNGWKQSNRAEEADRILRIIREEGVTSVFATPTHMVALARAAARQADAGEEEIYLRSILLIGEFAPNKTVMMLEETFQAMIFEHYGMAEMGLGCSFSCGYGKGSHIRETDIYIELINPITGQVVHGESPKTPGYSNYGEIVFTTLTRKGMPFIRYRTGDYSRWILEPCPCGSQLKRLDKVYPGEERK